MFLCLLSVKPKLTLRIYYPSGLLPDYTTDYKHLTIMTNSIRELTEKIYNEGVVKANREAELILAEAKKEAGEIINSAKQEKTYILDQAAKEASEVKLKTDSEIKLATQKLISNLKQKISNELISSQVVSFTKEAFGDEEYVKKMILLVIQNWAQRDMEESDLSLLIPKDEENKLTGFFKEKLFSELNKGIEIKIDPSIKYGFKIGPKGGNYIISFTEEDFENYFRSYLKVKTWNLIFGSAETDTI